MLAYIWYLPLPSKLTLSDNLIQELNKSRCEADNKFYNIPESQERKSNEQSKRSPKFCNQGLNSVNQSLSLNQQVWGAGPSVLQNFNPGRDGTGFCKIPGFSGTGLTKYFHPGIDGIPGFFETGSA